MAAQALTDADFDEDVAPQGLTDADFADAPLTDADFADEATTPTPTAAATAPLVAATGGGNDNAAAPAPTGNAIGDFFKRIGAGAASGAMDTLAGGVKFMQDAAVPGAALAKVIGSVTGTDPLTAAKTYAQDESGRFATDYGVDKARDNELASTIASGIGSLIPTLASGPAAPITAAAMMGESARKEAEAMGGSAGQREVAFYGNAAVGALTEKLLGLPALLKSAAAKKIPAVGLRNIVSSALKQAGLSAAREGTQEGLEQLSGNIIASEIAAYDPNRPIMQGVGTAALVGGIIGAPLGGVVQIASDIDAQTAKLASELDATIQPEGGGIADTSWRGGVVPPPLPVEPEPSVTATEFDENFIAGYDEEMAAQRAKQAPATGTSEAAPIAPDTAPALPRTATQEQVPLVETASVAPEVQAVAEQSSAPAVVGKPAGAPEPPVPVAPAVPAPELTRAVINDQNTRVETIVNEAVNSGRDRIEAENAARRVVDGANASGVNVDWALAKTVALAKPTLKRGGGKTTSLDETLTEGGETTKAETVASDAATPDVEARLTEIQTIADEERGKLTEKQQTILRMREEDASDAQIARATGDKPGSISQLHSVAKKQWRAAVDQRLKVDHVPEHLRPSQTVQDILDSQPATPETGMARGDKTEGGAAGGTGGTRTTTPTIGTTPRGDKHWLRIPAWFKRIGRGLFTEGARGVLDRTKNQVGKALAKATRQHVDVEQELYGQHEAILRKAVRAIPPKRLDAAFVEAEQFIRNKENGRPTTPLQPDAQSIVDAWFEVGKSTGDIARANNVQVWDAKLGKFRPMGTVGDYIPRMFRNEVERVLRDPKEDPALFNNLAQAIATHRGVPLQDAAAELRGVAGRFQANDFVGNLELARGEQLPEIFYEYDLRNLAAKYLPSYSERMAQIIAYGQRLGPRESPSRMNLWDIARKESEDSGTQEWLNAAEDQATGFRAKDNFTRNARRAQAIGNATLLSDPTTTVIRNLLSGLSVTAERFGVGRSIRQLAEATKTANRMDARELGSIRDDIGQFLGADQLGNSVADDLIRTFQQKALAASGFTGSETFVRTHNGLVASSFARDAAAALTSNPASRLSKEALAMFQRFDIDPEAIVSEGGDWRKGPETRKFIRTAVRESQGGYRFDQVPLWAGSTTGRFLYQYGRWAIQRANDIAKNTIKPLIGETVQFRGKTMTRRNVLPAARLGFAVVGLGEVFAALASALFDRDRKDASLEEIGEAWNEDELKAVQMMGERMVNDIIMAGTLGIASQPFDMIKTAKDKSRLKNPAEPPSMAGVKTLVELANKAADQGGTLTKADLLSAAAAMARGPKNVSDVARAQTNETLYEAQNDQRTLRNAAFRWAKSKGMDVSPKMDFGSVRKSENAPVFESINNALLTGNSSEAKTIANEFISSSKDKTKAREAVRASVDSRSPFRAGPFTSDKYQKQFMQWAKQNLSRQDLEQVNRVQDTYRKTAAAAGLDR